MMQFLRSGATMDKSQSTLYSMSTYLSGSTNSSRTRTMDSSDSNNNVSDDDDDDEHDESSSEFSFNECDITLIDDDDLFCDAKNDGELLYCQVVEMLRFEVEVCLPIQYDHMSSFFIVYYYYFISFILSSILRKCARGYLSLLRKNLMINSRFIFVLSCVEWKDTFSRSTVRK